MKKFHLVSNLIILSIIFSISPSEAVFWDKCKFMEEKPEPKWVKPGYEKAGFYVGVGISEKTKDEATQRSASKKAALSELSGNISTRVKSTFTQQITKNGGAVDNSVNDEVELILETKADELLKDVKFKDVWLNRKECKLWTLAIVSKKSVQKVKTELIMKNRFKKMASIIESITSRKNRQATKAQLNKINKAQHLLREIDFSYIPEEMPRQYHEKKLKKLVSSLGSEVTGNKGRNLISSLAGDNSLTESLTGKIIAHIKRGVAKSDRLLGGCNNIEDCMHTAAEQGFSRFTLIKSNKKVEQRNLGAFKGTLTVEVSIYDLSSYKIIKGPVKTFSQIVGWSDDDLNWDLAVKKIIDSKKLILASK